MAAEVMTVVVVTVVPVRAKPALGFVAVLTQPRVPLFNLEDADDDEIDDGDEAEGDENCDPTVSGNRQGPAIGVSGRRHRQKQDESGKRPVR